MQTFALYKESRYFFVILLFSLLTFSAFGVSGLIPTQEKDIVITPDQNPVGDWIINTGQTISDVNYIIDGIISIDSTDPVIIKDSNLTVYGQVILTSHNIVFDNVTIWSNETGSTFGELLLIEGENATITNSYFDGTNLTDGAYVINVDNGGNATISDNTVIANSGDVGINIGRDGSNTTLMNNEITAGDTGIEIRGGGNNTIVGNHVTSSSGGVLVTDYIGTRTENNTVMNNIINANGIGVEMYRAYNTTVMYNSITSGNDGVKIQSSTFNNVSHNEITVTGTSSGTAAIETSWVYSSVDGNLFAYDNTIINNTVNSAMYGLRLLRSYNDVFINNSITSDNMALTAQGADDSHFEDNYFASNIEFIDFSSGNTFINNIVETDTQILIEDSSSNDITNNDFYYSGPTNLATFIYLDGSSNTVFSNNYASLGVGTFELYVIASPNSLLENNIFGCECSIDILSDNHDQYSLDGTIAVDDIAPRIVNEPNDVSYSKDIADFSLIWKAQDGNPSLVYLYQNGSQIDFESWEDDTEVVFTFQTESLDVGTYEFEISFKDTEDNRSNHTVYITITEATPEPDPEPEPEPEPEDPGEESSTNENFLAFPIFAYLIAIPAIITVMRKHSKR